MPWPECVKPWPVGKPKLGEMSCGYIEFGTGRVHIRAGDWIVNRDGKVEIFTDKTFREIFEPAERKAPPFVFSDLDE